jgi:lipid-A-disaccharide synthase-like uncharacterized protein
MRWNAGRSHMSARNQLMPLWQQTHDSFSYHSPLLHIRSIKQGSKDCWHLVEALGSAIWPHRHCIFDRQWLEKLHISDFPLPGWILSQVFACHMSSVILTDIIQTVLETSVFSIQIWIAGSLPWAPFYPSYSILPPVPKQLRGFCTVNCSLCLKELKHNLTVSCLVGINDVNLIDKYSFDLSCC